MILRDTLESLLNGKSLSESEAGDLLRALTNAETPPAMSGALLSALRSKGVTADEVRGFARAMRSLARVPAIAPGPRAIDIVGTGGDASGSFNLSTGAALLTAACGVDVVKHGNRSVSSKSGSGYGECQFTAQAFADLDHDDLYSTFERAGAADRNGVNGAAGLYIDQDVE